MDVGAWLRELDLEQYEAAFRENGVSEKDLPHLTSGLPSFLVTDQILVAGLDPTSYFPILSNP